MDQMTIEVEKRPSTGTNVNRRLRSSGLIPAVVYGGGKDTVPIQISRKTLIDLMKGSGENAIFLLKLADSGGQERHAMIRDMQLDPVTRQVLHIDFQRIVMTEKVHVKVPVELTGVAYGVKNDGGMLDFVHREVEIECLPGNIPKHLEIDVTPLHIGQHVEAKDLTLPDGVSLLDEPDRVIVSLVHGRLEEAAVAGTAAAEPEVQKRGKGEEA